MNGLRKNSNSSMRKVRTRAHVRDEYIEIDQLTLHFGKLRCITMLFRFWVFPDCTFLDISIYTRNPLGLPPAKYREWVQAQQAA